MNKKIIEYIDRLMIDSKPERPRWHVEAIEQHKIPVWNYVDGCVMTGLIELSKQLKDEKYIDYVKKYIDYFINENGDIKGFKIGKYSLDDISESRVLFPLYEKYGDLKYLKAIHNTYNQIKDHPRTNTNNFWHKNIYKHQVWLDGLYMVMPFYAMYSSEFSYDCNFVDIINQYQSLRDILFDETDKLYHHAYDESRQMFWADKETGKSKNYWSRSIGWLLASMVDVYPYLENMNNQKIMINLFKETIDGLINYLDKDYKLLKNITNIDDPKNYIETSSSALLSYSLLKGVRLKMLDDKYEKLGKEIFEQIIDQKLIYANQKYYLKDICLVSGLGPDEKPWRDGSLEYYFSEPISFDDGKGSGPLIMAYVEWLKGEENESSSK